MLKQVATQRIQAAPLGEEKEQVGEAFKHLASCKSRTIPPSLSLDHVGRRETLGASTDHISARTFKQYKVGLIKTLQDALQDN